LKRTNCHNLYIETSRKKCKFPANFLVENILQEIPQNVFAGSHLHKVHVNILVKNNLQQTHN